MPMLEQLAACRIRVRGLVQGVGFRPAVHRLATSLNLRGWVCNDADGVSIHVEGTDSELGSFVDLLESQVPSVASIESITCEPAPCAHADDFQICVSPAQAPVGFVAQVPADRAVCADCRDEILDGANRRHRHAFASCIHCGPRYSIVCAMPYERAGTTMHGFSMCRACQAEFENPLDRRFRAEPIACPDCGPRLKYVEKGEKIVGDWRCVAAVADALRRGQILAIKGLGGYQLLVRADDEAAVNRLRERKRRSTKPFAVMVRSLQEAERIAHLAPAERGALCAPANPIVLLQSRGTVAAAVAPGLVQIGVFLPTTPLHVLLLARVDFPVVATSGNRSEEPIAIDDDGRASLEAIADAVLDHDRPIARRVDDSVVRVIDDCVQMIRLARGYAPCRLPALERWAAERGVPPILAVGSQQKTALAVWTGSQAVLAQHLGDMDTPEARRAFGEAVGDLLRLYRCEPRMSACDLHPDFFTTRWAQDFGPPVCQVQHHHAHAVAGMVEHDLLDRRVLGIVFDGTGFGPDGTIWGGEILDVTVNDFRRVASLEPFALPGGEAAIHEPNRIALSLLDATYAGAIPHWLVERLGFTAERAGALLRMVERKINSPVTSSVGRLFDAIAALILNVHRVSYEGEAAILLENAVEPNADSAYALETRIDSTGVRRGDWRPLIRHLVDDLANGIVAGVCAARFHQALAQWTASIASASELEYVVLSGGCFQNAYLLRHTRRLLEHGGKRVHAPGRIPANDGGLSVGQLAIAIAHWNKEQRN